MVDRLVEVGDVVKAGQALARLDPADHQLAVSAAADQVQAASVDAQQAASDEARLRRLLADGSVGAPTTSARRRAPTPPRPGWSRRAANSTWRAIARATPRWWRPMPA